jgi:outer membrane protein assembly factor BamE (lipoprotein component of BamABCDE complex)
MGLLLRILVVASGIGVGGFFLKSVDSSLAADPVTAELYGSYRAQILSALGAPIREIAAIVERGLHDLHAQPAAAAPAANLQASQTAVAVQKPINRPASKAQPAAVKLLPFITAGLTKDEVVAVLGNPTSSSGDKLVFGGSEFDLKDGKVAGWKLDGASPAIQVKLWPESAIDPSLDSFTVGSTKDEVLAVQGTPTLFSEDVFGYGGSEVYFQSNRVVRWRNDPASVQLRVAPR